MNAARIEDVATDNACIATADTVRPECLPACHCVPATEWASRKYDGTWDEDVGGCLLEQRTCRACGASFTREVT